MAKGLLSWREKGKNRWLLGRDSRQDYAEITKTLPNLNKLTKEDVFLADSYRETVLTSYSRPQDEGSFILTCASIVSGVLGNSSSSVNGHGLTATCRCMFSYFID